MVERLTKIDVQAFRGVPDRFTLDLLGGRSCVVLGDNSTGKSTIADGVEWYFRGEIEFLTKEGRRDGLRNRGASADVETRVSISTDGILGGVITASEPSPETARDVGGAELFLLRGRTLAHFVDKTKGDKWKDLAELLGLEAVDRMRLDLQRARNDLRDRKRTAEGELARTRSALTERGVEASEAGILSQVKRLCEAIGGEPPSTIDQALDPQWLQTIVPRGSGHQHTADLQGLIAELRARSAQQSPLTLIDDWNRFVESGEHGDELNWELQRAADSLLESDDVERRDCPLCGQPVEMDVLRRRIEGQLQRLQRAAEALAAAREAVAPLVDSIRGAAQARSSISQRAHRHGILLPSLPESPVAGISQKIDAVAAVERENFGRFLRELSSWDTGSLEALESAIPAPATARDQALIDIGQLHAEARAWRAAVRRASDAAAAFDLGERVFMGYQQDQHAYFSEVIHQISLRAAEIYQFLHPEEGFAAVAVETVGEKGAELSVEFHGKKESPPHRVLSESHLNSLGVAVFLAMAQIFNEELGFVVLDDVVSSFDRSHRGRLAELLVKQFGGTQLVVLTHDEQFYTRLSRLAPSWNQLQFTSWTYEEGPRTRTYESDRVLTDAQEALANDDRITAAQKARRGLEDFLQEACENLEALLPFRRGQLNDQRMADEVMRGLRRTLKDRSKTLYGDIQGLLTTLDADLQATLNVEAHANQSGASHQEVRDALERIHELRGWFTCADCETPVWYRGTPDASRCQCGRTHFPPPPAQKGSC